jgi:NAD(P)-dependent dehydrogenase (short-subunit alcohol dehydrogenase family)
VLTGLKGLVIGGSGTVGAEVVRLLVSRGVATRFSYFRGRERAEALAAETGARALALDLREPLPALEPADVLVHCAAVGRFRPLAELADADWDEAHAVNCRSAFQLARSLGPRAREIVLVGAMDRAQSLPLPVHFAATQGMLAAMTVALAKELGPATRVNLVALGPLGAGLSEGLSPRLLDDYRSFSALRRQGTPAEAARAIVWLALENRYMSGKVLSVNGGI